MSVSKTGSTDTQATIEQIVQQGSPNASTTVPAAKLKATPAATYSLEPQPGTPSLSTNTALDRTGRRFASPATAISDRSNEIDPSTHSVTDIFASLMAMANDHVSNVVRNEPYAVDASDGDLAHVMADAGMLFGADGTSFDVGNVSAVNTLFDGAKKIL